MSKEAGVHTLRYSFATHLLEPGYSIQAVQELLGHRNINTTMIYSHVTHQMHKELKSPLDL